MKLIDYKDRKTILGELDNLDSDIDIIKINNVLYSVCGSSNELGHIFLSELEPKPNFNREETNEYNVVCPVCSYEYEDSWEFPDEVDKHECGNCGAILEITREIAVTYLTKTVSKPKVWNYYEV